MEAEARSQTVCGRKRGLNAGVCPRQIHNPEYFVDENPYMLPTIDSVGIDIWTMDKGIMFDNIVIDSNPEKARGAGREAQRMPGFPSFSGHSLWPSYI